MIITIRKLGIATLSIIAVVCAHLQMPHPAIASDTTTQTTDAAKDDDKRQRRIHVAKRDDSDRGRRDRDRERRHYDPEVFRKFIKAELEHLPGLNRRMDRLIQIQSERQELQKQRQAVAANPGRDKSGTIERFHSLLRRDFALSDESRKIAQEIVSDLPDIQKQLDARRGALEKELAEIGGKGADPATSSSEELDLRRKVRYVEFLDKKLRDLEDHPERLDLLTRMVRGGPFDDWREGRHDIEARTPEDHLADLLDRKQKLQRELKQVDNEIKLLRAKGIRAKAKNDKAAEDDSN